MQSKMQQILGHTHCIVGYYKIQAMLCHALTGSLPLFLTGLNILKQVYITISSTIIIGERVSQKDKLHPIIRILLFMILTVVILMDNDQEIVTAEETIAIDQLHSFLSSRKSPSIGEALQNPSGGKRSIDRL